MTDDDWDEDPYANSPDVPKFPLVHTCLHLDAMKPSSDDRHICSPSLRPWNSAPGPEGGETLLDECHQAVIEEVLESGSENLVARYRNQRGFRASLKHFVDEHPERLRPDRPGTVPLLLEHADGADEPDCASPTTPFRQPVG